MTPALLHILRCPACAGEFDLSGEPGADGRIETGELQCRSCRSSVPIIRFVPRFVPPENYSSSFGFQWNRFRRTQLDSTSGAPISRDRFFRQSNWTSSDLAGKTVLDVGCGAGRFAEIALAAGAHVVAVDYSGAVDACWENLRANPYLHVVQASVYDLPFHKGRFDFVYCFGVLQHTPDVKAAFLALAEQVSRGGRLAVDVYPRLKANALWPKYWLRPLTRRIPPERLLPMVEAMVAVLFPVSLAVGRIPVIGRRLRYAIPVANYDGLLPLTRAQLKEWAVLDTFDMLAPAYDRPQSPETLRAWFREAGLAQVEVFRAGLVVGRGARP